MKRTHRCFDWLLVVVLIAALPGPGWACGPFFPDRILIEPDQAFLQLPYSTFSYEVRQVPAPYEPVFGAVPSVVGERETLGEAMARKTQETDLEELGKALETVQPDEAQRQRILAAYATVRAALTTADFRCGLLPGRV